MRTIEIDEKIWEILQKHAKPFVDTPNDVLRRLLIIDKPPQKIKPDYPPRNPRLDLIKRLQSQTIFVNPAFLTFLVYKYYQTLPNETSFSKAIELFIKKMKLEINYEYWNPWMLKAYKDWDSCQKTIAHFRECRRFGCWNDKNSKDSCNNYSCNYHPENPKKMKNKCDLTKGVIWLRRTPESEYELGQNYLSVIKHELLGNKKIPLRLFLSTFYDGNEFNDELVMKFKKEFDFTDNELHSLFDF